jgi:hypothetical protein
MQTGRTQAEGVCLPDYSRTSGYVSRETPASPRSAAWKSAAASRINFRFNQSFQILHCFAFGNVFRLPAGSGIFYNFGRSTGGVKTATKNSY